MINRRIGPPRFGDMIIFRAPRQSRAEGRARKPYVRNST
jgi:hypothetical protein